MSKIDGIKYPRKVKKWMFNKFWTDSKSMKRIANRWSRFMRRLDSPFNKAWISDSTLTKEQTRDLTTLINVINKDKITYIYPSQSAYITNV